MYCKEHQWKFYVLVLLPHSDKLKKGWS